MKLIRVLDKKAGPMKMPGSSSNAVSTETIGCCFRKARISCSSQELAQTDGEDSFKALND